MKELTLAVLCGAALVSVACGDDDDGDSPGTAGSTSAGTKSTGGSAGSKSTGGSAGTSTGGTTSAGTSSGGTGGSPEGGEPNGGTTSEGGTDGEGGAPLGGAGGAAAGAGGEGGSAEVVFDELKSGGFDVWNADKTIIAEWTNTSTPAGSSYFQWGQNAEIKNGEYKLAHWNAAAYTARTEQTVSPIANGKYSFSIWVNRAELTELNESYIYAKGFDAEDEEADVQQDTDLAVGDPYVEIKIDNIEVSSGSITVGVFTDAKEDGWINFDAASLVRLPD